VQIFTFNCSSQRLRRYSSGVIYAGSYPNTVFRFNFNTSDWDSVTKTAVFSYRGKNYRKPLDENDMCKVPKEVLYEGYFLVSVEGLAAPTNSVRIPVDAKPSDMPTTPDIDGNESIAGVKVLDGGAIIFDTPDNPPDDNPDSSDGNGVVDDIINNNIPFYSGLYGESLSKVAYKELNADTADYTDQGFYIDNGSDGKIASAGYQITFDANDENLAQTFAIYSTAKIIAAYQYQPAFNQWLDMGFDGVYWIEDGTTTQLINGKYITYTTYVYNVELMGDAITAPEYWRFEVEVL
jgi:hypothetical protein